jgi:hypothetical protein
LISVQLLLSIFFCFFLFKEILCAAPRAQRTALYSTAINILSRNYISLNEFCERIIDMDISSTTYHYYYAKSPNAVQTWVEIFILRNEYYETVINFSRPFFFCSITGNLTKYVPP